MARFIKNNKRNPLERTSSQGLVLGCPICAAKLDLLDTRDGDQAYWCHHCQSGWRAGNLPEAAHRSKDSANPEPQVEVVTAAVETRVTPKARAAKAAPERQKQLAALAPLTRLRRPLPQREAKKHAPTASRVEAKPLVIEVITPKRRTAPRTSASEPKTAAVKTAAPQKPALPKRIASPRVAEVAVSPRKTVAPEKALNETKTKPLLETNSKGSRRAAQTVAPISEPIKTKRQPLEAITPRTGTQKSLKKTLEIAVSDPQPKRTKRSVLETAAPIKAPTPPAKRSAPEPMVSGKGSRKLIVPTPKAPIGKRQPLEVAAKPKVSAPRVAAQKPSKKTLEVVTPIKAPRAKPSRREQPALATSKGARKAGQTAAPSPKAAIGKRRKLETVAPKASVARAAPQKPQKKTLEIVTPAKPSRPKKPIFETAAVAPRKSRQRKPALEPTPRPRRAARVAAPLKAVRAAPEQRKSRNAPASQPRAQRHTVPVEPSPKSRRAARVSTKPSPKPVTPEPTRAARVTKQPVIIATRPKSTRSSPPRPVPANPVQLGLFDALPMKIAPRKQR